jgi:hypothetical protein
VGLVVYKVLPRRVSPEYFGFSCQFSFQQLLHTQLSVAVNLVSPHPMNGREERKEITEDKERKEDGRCKKEGG